MSAVPLCRCATVHLKNYELEKKTLFGDDRGCQFIMKHIIFSEFKIFLSSDNHQISQSTISIIDHPKMP